MATERMVASGLATPLPAMSGAEPWIGSYMPCPDAFSAAEGNMPMEPVNIAAAVGQDVAEHVGRDHDVELLGCAHQLHGGIVDIHVGQLDVRIVERRQGDHVAPQLGAFEHVGLVHGAHAPLALHRDIEGDATDALDLDSV
jgi:hypothetical protein